MSEVIEVIEQGSEEWLRLRSGKFTGSKFVDIMARAKNDPSKKLKAWHDCVMKVVIERLTGQLSDQISAPALAWGKECEPYARQSYELETGLIVEEVAFIDHPDYSFIGASPDGLVSVDGGLELKCPKDSAVHVRRLLEGMEEEHLPQCQGGMMVTGRQWWDFVSFDPRMPEQHRLFIQRVPRDEQYIQAMTVSILEAESEARKILAKLNKEQTA